MRCDGTSDLNAAKPPSFGLIRNLAKSIQLMTDNERVESLSVVHVGRLLRPVAAPDAMVVDLRFARAHDGDGVPVFFGPGEVLTRWPSIGRVLVPAVCVCFARLKTWPKRTDRIWRAKR